MFSSTAIGLSATSTQIAAINSTGSLAESMASATSALPSVSLLLAASSSKIPKDGSEDGKCELLGPFALFVQGALGILAMSSLVWKRYRERPQRPLKIWAFDASKQVVGSVLVHIANLLMSMLSAGQLVVNPTVPGVAKEQYKPNPCSFYLLNLAIDTTIGIPILIVLLRLLTYGFSLTPLGQPRESIQSGHYGHPPKASWWMKQSLIYFLGLMGMKICVLFIFSILPWISLVGDWALRWTEGNEALQVVFVMLLFPLIMNAVQYYIIDSFIKNAKVAEAGSSDEDDDNDHQYDRLHGRAYGDSNGSDETLSFAGDDVDEALSKDEADDPTEVRSVRGSVQTSNSTSRARAHPRTTNGDNDHARDEIPGVLSAEQGEGALLLPSDRSLHKASPALR